MAILLKEQGFGGQQGRFSLSATGVEGDMVVVHLAALCPIAELDSCHHHAVKKRKRSRLLGLKQRGICHVHIHLVNPACRWAHPLPADTWPLSHDDMQA